MNSLWLLHCNECINILLIFNETFVCQHFCYIINIFVGEFLLPARANWLKLNVNQTGFFRVMYDEGLWNTLINLLRTDHKVNYF